MKLDRDFVQSTRARVVRIVVVPWCCVIYGSWIVIVDRDRPLRNQTRRTSFHRFISTTESDTSDVVPSSSSSRPPSWSSWNQTATAAICTDDDVNMPLLNHVHRSLHKIGFRSKVDAAMFVLLFVALSIPISHAASLLSHARTVRGPIGARLLRNSAPALRASAHPHFARSACSGGSCPKKNPFPQNEDSFGRSHTYLRVSLTDRCNFRCQYCMPGPEEELKFQVGYFRCQYCMPGPEEELKFQVGYFRCQYCMPGPEEELKFQVGF